MNRELPRELLSNARTLREANLPPLQTIYDRFPSPARHLLTSTRGWFLTRIRYAPQTFEILRELRNA